jgi:iron complex outermembrane receptor protein
MFRIATLLIPLQVLLVPGVASAQTQEVDPGLSALDSLLSLPVEAAAKYNQRRSDVAASVSIITSDEIAAYGFRTLADVFQTLPGFYVSDDLNYSYVGVRGFSRPTDYNNRLLVLLDGHVMNESFYGSTATGTGFGLDLSMLDRIEVVRGPGSALYGTSAMFAVVNLITKSGRQIDGVEVAGAAGSNGTREVSLLLGNQSDGGLNVMGSANWSDVRGADRYFSEFDDPSTNLGVAEGLDWDRWYGGRVVLTYGGFRLDLAGTSRSKGIPTAPWETEFNHPDQKTTDGRAFAQASLDLKVSEDKQLSARGFWDRAWYDGIYPYESLFFEESSSSTLGSEVRFLWDVSANNRLVGGVEGQLHHRARFGSWDADGEYFSGDFPFEQGSVYLQNELQLGPAGMTLGVRYDAYSKAKNAVSPRAALLLRASRTATVKLLYGNAFRVPTVYEREYFHEDDGIVLNPGLGPETIQTLEAAWEQRLGGSLLARTSLFRYRISDLIDLVETPTDPLLQRYDNISAATATGVELELTGALDGGITGYASYTFQRTRDETVEVELSNSPAHMAKLGFTVPLQPLILGTNAVYESGRLTVQDTRTASHFVLDLTLSSRVLAHGLSVTTSLRNVLGSDYRTPGGWEHVQAALPQHGRRFYVDLRLRF